MSNISFYWNQRKGSGMSALALMLHRGTKVQEFQTLKNTTFYSTWTRAGRDYDSSFLMRKEHCKGHEIIAGNAFRPDNNVEIAYAEQKWYQLQTLPWIPRQLYAWLCQHRQRHMVRHQRLGCCLMFCLTSQTLASWLGMERVEVLKMLVFVFWDLTIWASFSCLTTQEYSIITNIDFDHQTTLLVLEDVLNAFNDYAKQITKGFIRLRWGCWVAAKITANAQSV